MTLSLENVTDHSFRPAHLYNNIDFAELLGHVLTPALLPPVDAGALLQGIAHYFIK